MFPITREEYLKYIEGNPDFIYVGVADLNACVWIVRETLEIICLQDRDTYYAKSISWRAPE